jgi:hypothetical protein
VPNRPFYCGGRKQKEVIVCCRSTINISLCCLLNKNDEEIHPSSSTNYIILLCIRIRGIAKAGEPNNLSPVTPAHVYMDPAIQTTLRRKQRRLAKENPGILAAIAKGANMAIAECQHQFKNRRWNCSTRNFLRGKNLFGKIVDRGEHRESTPSDEYYYYFFVRVPSTRRAAFFLLLLLLGILSPMMID